MFQRARLRLTFYYVLFVAAILIGFDLGVATFTSQGLRDSLSEDLQSKAHQATQALIEVGGVAYFENRTLASDPSWSDVSLFIDTPSGSVLQQTNSSSGSVLPERTALRAAMAGRAALTETGSGSNRFMVYTDPVTRGGAVIAVIQVARSTRVIPQAMANLTSLMVASSLLALLVTFLAGSWLAGKTLEPIRLSVESQKAFVSDASHELRTPVTVIRTAAEAILRQREAPPPRIRRLAEDIVAESAQLGRLVEDLGTLAQSESRRGRLRRDPIQVAALFAEVAAAGRLLAEAGGVELEAGLTGDGTILGDAVRLRQTFSILLDNAVKFSPRGAAVNLVGTVADRRFVVRVVDRGPGIAEADLPRIFERFFRGAGERQREGTGLGLAIARELVDEHRGTISVRSVVGTGTEFIVDLPLGGDARPEP
ncbi:MAG TPA: HAMP domain-containing sensor histidine kinase [Candidatus Dormibacteraeota bacterium]|nr:HAMP domain-containing sensor histidine kinase [Candidatus Dormibacteraeota bacterium]